MNLIAVDPGVHGALSLFVDNGLRDIVAMPTVEMITGKHKLRITKSGDVHKDSVTRDRIDPTGVFDLIMMWSFIATPVEVVVERVHGMPHQSGQFVFGQGYGWVEMAAISLGLPLHYAEPNTWKRALGCSSDKKVSLRIARERFPAFAGQFKRVTEDDGRAESALIGVYHLSTKGHTDMRSLPKAA